MTDLLPQVPILVFRRPYLGRPKPGREDLQWFDDAGAFRRTSPGEIRGKTLQGALLVDITGMSWRVLDVIDEWFKGKFLVWLYNQLRRGDSRFVRYELKQEGKMSFEAVRDRVCLSIMGSPDVWCDWRLIGSKGRRSEEVREVLEAKAAKVRQATNMRELFSMLDAIS